MLKNLCAFPLPQCRFGYYSGLQNTRGSTLGKIRGTFEREQRCEECMSEILKKIPEKQFLFQWFAMSIVARCPRHIQSVSNWIVDILIWDIHVMVDWQLSKRVSADQCHQQTKTGRKRWRNKNKQTREEGKKDKGAGVSLTDYKPKRYLKIYYVYMPQPYGHGSQLLNNNLQCI